MKIVDCPINTRALSLDDNETLTEKQLADALFATGCHKRRIADRTSAEVFDALGLSVFVYHPVKRYVPKAS